MISNEDMKLLWEMQARNENLNPLLSSCLCALLGSIEAGRLSSFSKVCSEYCLKEIARMEGLEEVVNSNQVDRKKLN